VEDTTFLEKLVTAGLLVPTGVPGVMGRSGAFERVLLGFDALIDRSTAADGAEVVRFPPLIPKAQLEKSGYLTSFPHLAGSVFSFSGSEAEAIDLAARVAGGADWSDLQTQTDVMITPSACYPVYPWVAAAGALPPGGRLIDISGACFRHEPSADPARLQSFRMHELVRIGARDEVLEWHASWMERGGQTLSSVGLVTEIVPASDPFFGRGGRMLAANQREQNLKFERVFPIAAERPTPIMSVNYHQDHFALDFGIRTSDDLVAHSACLGFGLERVALALFREHGLDTETWPEDVQGLLGL
jgi:seryl-tRNA synthetase